MDKLLYGDFEEQYTDYETAEIAILPVQIGRAHV